MLHSAFVKYGGQRTVIANAYFLGKKRNFDKAFLNCWRKVEWEQSVLELLEISGMRDTGGWLLCDSSLPYVKTHDTALRMARELDTHCWNPKINTETSVKNFCICPIVFMTNSWMPSHFWVRQNIRPASIEINSPFQNFGSYFGMRQKQYNCLLSRVIIFGTHSCTS